MPEQTKTRQWDADHSAVTDMAGGLMDRKRDLDAEIQAAGGVITVGRFELRDLDGNLVDAKLIDGQYGECWKLAAGGFVGHAPKRESTLTRKGYTEAEVLSVVAGHAELVGGGTGTGGMGGVMVFPRPDDEAITWHRIVGIGDLTNEED